MRGPAAITLGLVASLLLADSTALAAEPPPAPSRWQGHWEGDHADKPRVCLDLLPHDRLRLTFEDSRYRRAVVVEGPYKVQSRHESAAELELRVDRVVTKELGRCRSTWVRQELPSYKIASLTLSVGSAVGVRVELGCAAKVPIARLCLRQNERELLCRRLSSPRGSDCQPEPPYTLDRILPPEAPPE